MAVNQLLAQRIREKLQHLPDVREVSMMGGLAFMIQDQMCLGVWNDDLLCRIDPADKASVLRQPGCREMRLGKRTMRGFVLVNSSQLGYGEFDQWVERCLASRPVSKSSKKN